MATLRPQTLTCGHFWPLGQPGLSPGLHSGGLGISQPSIQTSLATPLLMSTSPNFNLPSPEQTQAEVTPHLYCPVGCPQVFLGWCWFPSDSTVGYGHSPLAFVFIPPRSISVSCTPIREHVSDQPESAWMLGL
jgi:hypothetical protein